MVYWYMCEDVLIRGTRVIVYVRKRMCVCMCPSLCTCPSLCLCVCVCLCLYREVTLGDIFTSIRYSLVMLVLVPMQRMRQLMLRTRYPLATPLYDYIIYILHRH